MTSSNGEAVGMGMLHVLEPVLETSPRLELSFETETLRAQFRVPLEKLDALVASWDGALYRYSLPPDAHPSLFRRQSAAVPPAAAPVIETFPLPISTPSTGKVGTSRGS